MIRVGGVVIIALIDPFTAKLNGMVATVALVAVFRTRRAPEPRKAREPSGVNAMELEKPESDPIRLNDCVLTIRVPPFVVRYTRVPSGVTRGENPSVVPGATGGPVATVVSRVFVAVAITVRLDDHSSDI